MEKANFKGANNIFSKRLKSLMSDSGTTQDKLAKELDVKRQTISLYINGSSVPPLEKFVDIANYFGVTTDYLLGVENYESLKDCKAKISSYTGLNSDSIEKLHKCYKRNGNTFADFFNFLICDFNTIQLLNDYFKSFIFDELEGKEKYRYIPRKRFTIAEEVLMKKLYFYNIVEKIPKIRDNYINALSEEQKDEITLDYLFTVADIKACNLELSSDCPKSEYAPTDEDWAEADKFYSSAEYQDKIAASVEEYTTEKAKTTESIKWFLSELKKKQKNYNFPID